jgi:hypothetical protein
MMLEPGLDKIWQEPFILDLFTLLVRADKAAIQSVREEFVRSAREGVAVNRLASVVQRGCGLQIKAALRVADQVMGYVLSKHRWMRQMEGGATHKTWVCGMTCPILGHGQAQEDSQKSPVPVNEPFLVNRVKLMFPRDFESGHVKECIFCDCLALGCRLE